MKRNDAEPIGKLIQKYLRQESLTLAGTCHRAYR